MHGLLILDKPGGMTSRDAVNRVQRLAGRKTKIGHAGTLDPMATGVLVVCLGAATRLVDRIQEYRKGYVARLQLGVRSDTDDSTGQLSPGEDPSRISTADLLAALQEFCGSIEQVPPKFSAVHVDGRRAYAMARTQQEFELSPRTVEVDAVTLLHHAGAEADLDIVCGSGTYIRALIRDLGERLGCGAVMTALRRTWIGPFSAENACSVDELSTESLTGQLLPLRSVLDQEPRYQASAEECAALLQGRRLAMLPGFEPVSTQVAVLDPSGELFAMATWDAGQQRLQPARVFAR